MNDVREELFQLYGNKCVKCGISEEDCEEKYDKSLELHHVHPISFDGKIWSVNPIKSFVPLCPKCHIRGPQ